MPFGRPTSADLLPFVALLAAALFCSAPALAQDVHLGPRFSSQQVAPQLPPSSVDHLHGVVINSLDGKPVPRVLVTTIGNQGFAVLTDYEGRFSFDLRRPLPQSNQGSDSFTAAAAAGQTTTLAFNLRKPGYTSATETALVPRFTPSGAEAEIRLPISPAGLISGHVSSASGSIPPFLTVQLRRKQINDGTAFYTPVSSVQADPSGNYRFPDLTPGDYKVTTAASTENSASRAKPTQQPDSLPGLLPAVYPDVNSVESAAPIHIGPGATVIADLDLRAAPFYRVTISIASSEGVSGVTATLSPDAPGLQLSYNTRLGAVVGYLPSGTYTVHLRSAGRVSQIGTTSAQARATQALLYPGQQTTSLSGTLTINVADAPLKTAATTLHPGFDIPVNIRRDFTPDETAQSPVPHYLALPNGQQIPNPQSSPLTLNLIPVDLGNGFMNTASSVPQSGGDLHIPNVSEGTYRVRVFPRESLYVAAINCGATNLLREPLVIGPSGLNAAIEVTLRNDGASLKLLLDDQALPGEVSPSAPAEPALAAVSVVPLDAPQMQALLNVQILHPPASAPYNNPMGQFSNLAPGSYLVLAFRTNRNPLVNLEYNDPKVREALLAKGTVVTLSPNQKAEVRVPVLPLEAEN